MLVGVVVCGGSSGGGVCCAVAKHMPTRMTTHMSVHMSLIRFFGRPGTKWPGFVPSCKLAEDLKDNSTVQYRPI